MRREETDDDHGERHAERIIGEMLKALGLEEAELLSARKGDWRKRLIGQRVRQETSVSLRWLAARLRMGSEGHISRITGDLADLADHPGRRSLERVLQRNARKDCTLLLLASDHGVSEAIYLRDPDGNGVELYWDRPSEEWPRTAKGELAMGTAPLDLNEVLKERN